MCIVFSMVLALSQALYMKSYFIPSTALIKGTLTFPMTEAQRSKVICPR